MRTFINRIVLTVAIVYKRYVYRPRIAKKADTRRLVRVLLLLFCVIGSVFFYAYITDGLASMPFVGAQRAGDLVRQTDVQTDKQTEGQKQAQPATKHYTVSVLQASKVKAYELQNRLEQNQKKLYRLQQEHKQRVKQNDLSRKKDPLPVASSFTESPSEFSAYEIGVERKLEQAGRDLYEMRYNSAGLQGQALVRVIISSGGQLRKVEVLQSSGSRNVDKLLIASVRQAAPFAAFPEDMERDSYTMERYLSVTP